MMRLISRRPMLRAVAAAGLGIAAAPAIVGRAQAAPLKFRMSSSLPDDPKFSSGRVAYDTLVKHLKLKGLGEQIQVDFFPNNQLGQEIDVINSVKLGVVDLMIAGSSIAANLVPIVGVLDLGYMFNSFPHQTKALDSGAAKLLEDPLLKAANIRVAAWEYNFGARSVLAKKAVHGPADLTGMKIRTLPNPVITECLRLMGAAATPLAFGEIYTALQAGVLDGLEHDPPTILASKFYETAKFYSLTEHIFNALPLFISNASFNKMDPGTREIFMAAALDAAIEARAWGLAVEKEALGILQQNGVTVINPDKEAFRKRVLPQTDNFLKVHPESKPIIDIIRATA